MERIYGNNCCFLTCQHGFTHTWLLGLQCTFDKKMMGYVTVHQTLKVISLYVETDDFVVTEYFCI